jgi:uncharacterized membrane protein SpoIIM required for sporulation
MRETEFIRKNKDKWQKYETTLKREQQDPDLLSELYVHTTDDLSYSRTFYPNRSVRVYLNGLARRTFLQLYKNRQGEARRFLTFWTDELPRILYAWRRALLVSLLIFLLAMAIGVVSFLIDPEFAKLILSDEYVNMTREYIRSGDPMAVYKQRSPFSMFLTITFNNIFVALQAFIMGAFFALGTVVVLVNNGIMLGVFQYFFVDQGLFRESFLTIWIHGALEISSIVIAGGAGLVMGSGLLFPGTYSRLQSFGRSARDGLKIMLGTIPLFIIAGFLEGYLTRHTELPDSIRFFFILTCFAFIGWYYWYYPRKVVRENPVSTTDKMENRATPTDRAPIVLNHIKMIGEVLTDTFTILRRSGSRLFVGLLATSFTFCLLVFGLTSLSPGGRFAFSDVFFFSSFYNIFALTSTFGFGRDLTFFCSVFIGMYTVLLLTLRNFEQQVTPGKSRDNRSLIRLLLPTLLLTLCFSLPGSWMVFVVFLVLPFILNFAYLSYSGNGSFAKAFKYTYARLASNYSLFLLLLLLGIFTLFMLDTAVSYLVFTALNWVIAADGMSLYDYNTVILAFLYWTYFGVLLAAWITTLSLNFHSLREEEEATGLRERIKQVGIKQKLRGLELEEG